MIDLLFPLDFDQIFIHDHMEFNHCTDDNIGQSGFFVRHHLVRYYLIITELKKIKKELEDGSLEAAPTDAVLKIFCLRLTLSDSIDRCDSVENARSFIEIYIMSLQKHNKRFTTNLLCLASFVESETSTLVAKMMIGQDYGLSNDVPFFKSTMHRD